MALLLSCHLQYAMASIIQDIIIIGKAAEAVNT